MNKIDEKIELVIDELTLEEKINMIHGVGLFQSGDVSRLNIPPVKMSDGPMGVRNEFKNDGWQVIGNSDDYVTYCPSNSAIAATWNKDLAYAAGKVLGEEARGRGKDVILAPGINVKRVPVCGRNFEYMSEDPYLISEMAVPLIEGIQESDVAACVKHFAVNSQETERLWVNVEVSERALREIYLPGFEAAVKKGKSKSIMGAYNLFRGEHCCQNKELLGDILRDEWGYNGMIVSDWGGVHDTKTAANSPLDIEMSVTSDFDEYNMATPLLEAVKAGEVDESCIDEKIRYILLMMLDLKMINIDVEQTHDGKQSVKITRNPERKAGSYNTPEHREMCLKTARESIVLLKNEEERLPLKAEKLRKLLVIGDNAERLHANGGGSAEIKALYEISPLMGLKCQLGGNCEVTFARGYYVPEKQESETNWQEDSINNDFGKAEKGLKDDKEQAECKKLRDEAVALAKEADEVIIIGGLNHDHDVEGYDRETLRLPYDQDTLISEVLKVNPNAVVVMMAGSPVSMETWRNKAKAIVWMSYCGLEGGNALAEVLLGKVNPSGKLTESMPAKLELSGAVALGEYPGRELTTDEKKVMNAHLTETYKDDVFVGYRYYEKYQVPVQFVFGHGLSYTTFAYENIRLIPKNALDAEMEETVAVVEAEIKNTGKVEGKEIVQLYIGKENPALADPVKELKGFAKIDLKPGESKTVTLALNKKAFSHYNEEAHKWTVDAGVYKISLGSSLTDIKKEMDFKLSH